MAYSKYVRINDNASANGGWINWGKTWNGGINGTISTFKTTLLPIIPITGAADQNGSLRVYHNIIKNETSSAYWSSTFNTSEVAVVPNATSSDTMWTTDSETGNYLLNIYRGSLPCGQSSINTTTSYGMSVSDFTGDAWLYSNYAIAGWTAGGASGSTWTVYFPYNKDYDGIVVTGLANTYNSSIFMNGLKQVCAISPATLMNGSEIDTLISANYNYEYSVPAGYMNIYIVQRTEKTYTLGLLENNSNYLYWPTGQPAYNNENYINGWDNGGVTFMLGGTRYKFTSGSKTQYNPEISTSESGGHYYLNITCRNYTVTSYKTRSAGGGSKSNRLDGTHPSISYTIDGVSYTTTYNSGSTQIGSYYYYTKSIELTASQYFGSHTYTVKNLAYDYTGNSSSILPYRLIYRGQALAEIIKYKWVFTDSSVASLSETHNLPAPTNLSVKQNYIDRSSSPYVDSLYISWSAVPNATSYGYELSEYEGQTVDWGTVNGTSLTIDDLPLDKYTIEVWGVINNSAGDSTTAHKQMVALTNPTNVSFSRTGVNAGTLSWTPGILDSSLTYFEVFDGNTSLGTTNNNSYSLSSIAQGSHTYGVKMVYNNTDGSYSSDYNSSKVTTTVNMTILPTPTLTLSEDYDDVVFMNSEGDDCYLLTDGTFVKVSDYTSGQIKQGIMGVTFSYPISPSYGLTGVSYAFYNKLNNNAYAYDTDVANNTRSVSVGDTTYASVGVHKVKVKAVFSDDTDYNSADSNEVEYPVNTLDAPTLVWGEVNHPSSQVTPSGYTPIEYIESDGSQYIDTGWAPPQLAKIDIEFMYLSTTYSGWTCLYGVRGSANTSYFGAFINSTTNMLSPNYSTFDPGSNSTTEIVPNGYMHIRTDKGNLYLNNQLQQTCSTALNNRTTPDCNLYLFALNTSSGVSNRNIKARIYDCNLYNDTTQVRQFIPVRRNADNKAGLYDLLSSTFYPSSSGSDFIAGPDIILYDSNKIYESRIEWMPVSTVTQSGNFADYYFVEVIGNDVPVGTAVTILQPSDLTQRVGTWIPDPDPLNGAVKGLISQLPSQTTSYVVNVRALSFNSWYVGGSTESTATYTINRLAVPQLPSWDADTFTISWSPVTDANTYYLYDSGVLIETITGATSYRFLNLEDGLHQFRVTAMKRTFAVN